MPGFTTKLKMKVLVVSFLVAALAGLSNAWAVPRLGMMRDISIGACPEITNKEDLEVAPYLGSWYEIERFDIVWQANMDCVEAIYSDLGDGVVEVHNVARTAEGEFTEIIGNATVVAPGVLFVVFEDFQYAWILSRTTTLDQATYDHARQVFANNNIDLSLFHPTYQGDDCPYLETR